MRNLTDLYKEARRNADMASRGVSPPRSHGAAQFSQAAPSAAKPVQGETRRERRPEPAGAK